MASASPSVSPPRTPVDTRTVAGAGATARKSATPVSDDSSIEDLSFDYVMDEQGKLHRISKGSSKSSQYTPPTPPDDTLESANGLKRPPSPIILNSPVRRSSLSRSESAYSVLEPASSGLAFDRPERPPRSFSRVASGPLLSTGPSYAASTTSSTAKPRSAPRRITLDEALDKNDLFGSSSRPRQMHDSHLHPAHHLQDEKENIDESDENPYLLSVPGKQRHSPPLTSRSSGRSGPRPAHSSASGTRPLVDVLVPQRGLHTRQIASGPNRAGRMLKSISTSSSSKYSGTSASVIDRYYEAETSENEHGATPAPASYNERNPSVGITLAEDTDGGEDAEIDPANIPIPGSATSSMFGRQRSLVLGTAAASSLSQSSTNRPRRSASLSDALAHDDYQLQVQQQYLNGQSRPGTSLGMSAIAENPDGARRVTIREREKQEAEILSDCEKYIREHEFEHRTQGAQPPPRQSPSPTHNQNLHQARLAYGHHRQESDTLKSSLPLNSSSPTAVDHQSRASSRLAHGRTSPPSSRPSQDRLSPPSSSRLQVRISPPAKGRVSPSGTRGRISPSSTKGRSSPPNSRSAVSAGTDYVRHRRSPTAPEPPTTSNLVSAGASVVASGKTWAGSEREEDYQSEQERERRLQAQSTTTRQPSPQSSLQPTSAAPAPAQALMQSTVGHAPAPPIQSPRHIVVNKKVYARLDMIGKGGSSRVFRVMSQNNELYAIKRVSLDRTETEMMNGYMNEISLLKRLEGNSRIIRLIDSEVRAGPGGTKGHLLLVMECGEIDLARLLQDQMKHPLNMVWVAYYWQQMLQAVHVIHEEKIVHSDLKPANFVLVRGQLKLIDFGIANAIANDTTNIHREHQVGTLNYMSPEAIELADGQRRLKVGRPSDVWSLGVILYQMIYGHPPFQHLALIQKMRVIPDHSYVIEFPEYSIPTLPGSKSPNGDQITPPTKLEHLKRRVRSDVINSMKKCLTRNSKERATIPELLEHGWLSMNESELDAPVKPQLGADETIINPYYMRQLLQYGIKLGVTQGDSMDPDALLREAERLVVELKALHP